MKTTALTTITIPRAKGSGEQHIKSTGSTSA